MRHWVATAACTLAATVAATIVLTRNGAELTAALDRLPIAAFAAAVALHGVMLVVRTEAWRLVLVAADERRPSRPTLHTASAVGFLVGAIETPAALPVRMAVLRRLAPAEAPGMRALAFADAPVFALECCLAALLLVVAAGALGVPWWASLVSVAATAAVVLALRLMHARLERHPLAAGLRILGVPRVRWRLALLVVGVVGLTIVRCWMLAAACGLPAGVADAALLYLAVSTIGLLPIGPASSPAATVAVAGGSAGVGAAGAAGLAISASSIGAVLIYAAATLAIHMVSRFRFRARPALTAAAERDRP